MTTVFIPVHGVVLDCDTVNLGMGVELIAPEDVADECLTRFSDTLEGADCFCAVSIDAPSSAPAPIAAVRHAARSTLTALRMFKPGSVSLGLTAQADVGGAWRQVSLPFTGRAREEAWRLLPGEDEELRQFIAAVRRVERRTRISWSLKRFEMGLERTVPAEGLTDFLAALRALLEAHDESGKSALPARVSALCARDAERLVVRSTIEAAFALERLAIDGHIGRADRKRLGKQPPLEVIADTERYLRALLHDLVCGYLATDLKKLADEILLADGEPAAEETGAHESVYLEPVPSPGEITNEAAALATVEFEAVFDDTAEINVADTRDDIEPAVPSPDPDNVWTLRPASEVSANPANVAEHSGEMPAIPTYDEQETDSRMRQLAEDLVDDFENTIDGAVWTEPEPRRSSRGLSVQASRIGGALARVPKPLSGEASDPAPVPLAGPVSARRSIDDPQDAGFTFDFAVVAEERPAREEQRVTGDAVDATVDPRFPVREFDLPLGPGAAATEADDAVEGPPQRHNFLQIMDENFTPPPRNFDDRPTTPVGRDGRPHLVAIDGAAAMEPDLEPLAPVTVEPEPPQSTQEFDVLAEFERDPNGALSSATGETVEPAVSTEAARTHAIGPATIEFRPLVNGDVEDPDDFAGAC